MQLSDRSPARIVVQQILARETAVAFQRKSLHSVIFREELEG
jgi:hypothetical protein